MTEQREVRCPQCGETKQNIGNHWRLSASCDYPTPTPRQRQIIRGLLFAGGNINENHGSRNSQLVTTSTKREFLEWLTDEFGVMGRSIHTRGTTAELQETLAQYGDRSSGATSDTTEICEWRTRNLPVLSRFKDEWYQTDEHGDYAGKQAPPNLEPHPMFLRIVYAKRGQAYTLDDSRVSAVITITNVPATTDECLDLFEQFSPRRRLNSNSGIEQLVLNNSRAFFDHIGWNPIPGLEHRWPDESDLVSPLDPDSLEECPTCGVEFSTLSNHWATGECDYPPVPQPVRDMLLGLLSVGGGMRSNGSSSEQIILRSTNRAFLDSVYEHLRIFGLPPKREEIGSENTPENFPDGWDVSEDEAKRFKDVYRLLVRSHPEWVRVREDLESDQVASSREVLQWMYAFRGALYEDNGSGTPTISITNARLSRDSFIQLFEQFDPTVVERAQSVQIQLRDVDGFFEFVGSDPVRGCEEKWPSSSPDNQLLRSVFD